MKFTNLKKPMAALGLIALIAGGMFFNEASAHDNDRYDRGRYSGWGKRDNHPRFRGHHPAYNKRVAYWKKDNRWDNNRRWNDNRRWDNNRRDDNRNWFGRR